MQVLQDHPQRSRLVRRWRTQSDSRPPRFFPLVFSDRFRSGERRQNGEHAQADARRIKFTLRKYALHFGATRRSISLIHSPAIVSESFGNRRIKWDERGDSCSTDLSSGWSDNARYSRLLPNQEFVCRAHGAITDDHGMGNKSSFFRET